MEKCIFVFDLDFTIWDAGGTWCDCTVPPYSNVNNHVIDAYGAEIVLYDDVKNILNLLKDKGKTIAAASRTNAPHIAIELLERFGIRHFFHLEEIYPSSKIKHLNQIIGRTGNSVNDIVFFDDEMRNIHEVSAMGIKSIHLDDGLKMRHIKPYL